MKNSLTTAASAASTLVARWDGMTDIQRYEMAQMVARRTAELQDALLSALNRMERDEVDASRDRSSAQGT
jgi:tellurite resistance protein